MLTNNRTRRSVLEAVNALLESDGKYEGITGPTRIQIQEYFDKNKLVYGERKALRLVARAFGLKPESLRVNSSGQVVSYEKESIQERGPRGPVSADSQSERVWVALNNVARYVSSAMGEYEAGDPSGDYTGVKFQLRRAKSELDNILGILQMS